MTLGRGVACLAVAVGIVFLPTAADSSDARRKTCKTPPGAMIAERSSRAVVFSPTSGQSRAKLITFYGCARGIGKRFFVFKCDPGQITVDTWQTARVKNHVAILEIERKTEGSESFFHVTRPVSLRTGKRRDTRSASRPQPPGTQPIFEC